MPTWTDNSLMFWHDGSQYRKVTDHGRDGLSVSVERIENKKRMVNGTQRRHSISKKRTFSASWVNLPNKNGVPGYMSTADGGWAGEDIENFHNNTDGAFNMQLRKGDGTVTTYLVMISDFSKTIEKRGPGIDLWSLSITLEEV